MAGTRRTLSTDAVVTVTVALMPERTVAGGLVRVTVTAYVATLLAPLEDEATGTIWVSVPGTETPAPVTDTEAVWPTLRLEMSDSAKLALATIGPTDSSIAYPLVGALTPGRTLTAMIRPSAGAVRVAAVTAA